MSSTDPLLVLFFTTGLAIGIGHCIGMCGPIVVALSLSMRGQSAIVPHLLYNFGRIITYGILGGAMGVVGSFTVVASHIEGVQKVVMIATGVLCVAIQMLPWDRSTLGFERVYRTAGSKDRQRRSHKRCNTAGRVRFFL